LASIEQSITRSKTMKLKLLVAASMALTSIGAVAYAGDTNTQNKSAVTGAAGGAATGAIVGGPIGAVVGGVVGLAAGAAIDPPPAQVVTYVQEQPMPQDAVIVQQPVVVGKAVPAGVVIQQIPDNDTYAYTVINHQRVIIDPETNTVVQVIN
jgi:hypothetical protein